MKTGIRGWKYTPPTRTNVLLLVLLLAFIGAVFVWREGTAHNVLVGVVVVCIIVQAVANRFWEKMTPFRWVLLLVIVVVFGSDYLFDSPVTHAARGAFALFMLWFIFTRPHMGPLLRKLR